MADQILRIYEQVPLKKKVVLDAVIPDGMTWEIETFIGNAGFDINTTVMLMWDFGGGGEEIMLLTNGEMQWDGTFIKLEGDGVKKIAIVLANSLVDDAHMGGYLLAQEYNTPA